MSLNVKPINQVWVGVAYVIPVLGSEQDRSGLKGGYGFVAFKADDLVNGVQSLRIELAEGGSDLVGFEWLHRVEDNDRALKESDFELLQRLDTYPIQFREFDWFKGD